MSQGTQQQIYLQEHQPKVLSFDDKTGRKTFPVNYEFKASLSFQFSNELQKILTKSNSLSPEETANSYLELSKLSKNKSEIAIALIEAAKAFEKAGMVTKAMEIRNRLIFVDDFESTRDTEGRLIILEAKFIFLKLEPVRSHKFTEILADLVFLLSSYEDQTVSTLQRIELSNKITQTFPNIFLPLVKPEKSP